MPDGRPGAPLARLEADGLLRREDGRWRTTRRWQGAMARAALQLLAAGAPDGDLRLPVAAALAELWPAASDAELAAAVEALLPIEAAELGPAQTGAAAPPPEH